MNQVAPTHSSSPPTAPESPSADTPTVTDAQVGALRSPALRELVARGLVYQCSDLAALDARMCAGPIVAYNGYDLTAPSLHVGNLVTLMMLRTLQRHGHHVIVLLGSGTTKIGDPSGKDDMRQMLDAETIQHNRDRIETVVRRFLDFGDGSTVDERATRSESVASSASNVIESARATARPAVLVDNAEWLDELAYIPFLRDVGSHFTINRMLTMESVQRRLERSQPLTFLEFNYMILQAYDFAELHARHDCVLQTGGSDQWGNIINGVELGRRMRDAKLFALTAPLLLNSAGQKMGKTVGGAVWLSADLMSPYEFWQYWRNIEDDDVLKVLGIFGDVPDAEMQRLAGLQGSAINDAKVFLATELTTLVHGRAIAHEAAATARETFADGGSGRGDGLPRVAIPRDELEAGIPFFLLLGRSGLVGSNSEGRRLIQQGGGRVNDIQVTDPHHSVTFEDLNEGELKISAGKKKHAIVHVETA